MADPEEVPADPEPTGRCRFCGAFTTLELGGGWICESCYEEKGSCCQEGPEEDGC